MASTVTVDTAQLQRAIAKFPARAKDCSRQLDVIGEDIIAAIQDRFTSGGFQALAASTLKFKARHGKSAQPLIFNGTWRREHHKRVEPRAVDVLTTVPYAVYHVSDGPRSKIPLRNPYDLPAEVYSEAARRLANFIATGDVT